MRKIFYRYFIQTQIAIGPRIDHLNGKKNNLYIKLPNQEIVIYERISEIKGRNAFSGLYIDCYVTGKNSENDIFAYNSVNYVLCILTLCTLTPYLPPFQVFKYDASPNLEERDFIHSFKRDNFNFASSVRQLNMEIFKEVWQKVDKYQNQSIVSAIYQINKSLQAVTLQDEFISLWLGLEYISDLVAKSESIKRVKTLPNCRHCKTVFENCPNPKCNIPFEPIDIKGKYAGISQFAERNLIDSNFSFDYIHKLRSRIIHESGKFLEQDKLYIPYTRELLIKCLSSLTEIDPKMLDLILALTPKKQTYSIEAISMHQIGLIRNLNTIPSIKKVSDQPWIETTPLGEELNVNDDGTINYRPTASFNFVAPLGVNIRLKESQIIANDTTGIIDAELKVEV